MSITNDGSGDILELNIFGYIGEDWWSEGSCTKENILNEIKKATFQSVTMRISSLGGDIDHALAIKDLVIDTNAPCTAIVSGLTASSATIIMMAAGKIQMSSDASILIHNTSTFAYGTKKELRKAANELEVFDNIIASLYERKTGKKWEEISAKMDEDTWMNAQSAKEFGIVDEVITKVPVAASVIAAINNAANAGKIKLPTGFSINAFSQKPNTNDMAENNKATNIISDFFQNLKAAGMKIISDDTKTNSKQAESKIKDLTEKFVKAIEEVTTPSAEETNVASYSATVAEPVDSIELEDGSALVLSNAPYEVSEAGATALQEDLTNAITADSVSVEFADGGEAGDAMLTINVTGTESALATVNGTIEFTVSESATEEDAPEPTNNQVLNLKKKIAANKKAIEAAKKEKMKNSQSDEIAKLKAELAKTNATLENIKKGKSGGKSAGSPIDETDIDDNQSENGGAKFARYIFKNK